MYKDKSATELSLLIRQKKSKPSEICADFISRIEEVQSKTNAFITFDKESVMKHAEELDKQPVTPETSPIFGLPVAVSDNICTSDMPTTCGSKMLTGFNAFYDATVVARLKERGAVIIGKSNLEEFNMGTSGKTAEAVASGCVPFILGSDIDGSLRLPAAYCGAVGYKPTYGAVSRYGLISYAGSFDQIGSIARTVSDAALLVSAVAGYDEMDANSNPKFTLDFSRIEEFDASNINIKGKKIGIPKEYKINGDIQTAVEIYKSLGVELVDISLPLTEYGMSVYYILSSAEASSNLAKFDGLRYGYRTDNFNENDVDSLYINSRTEGFGEEVKRRIILGTYVLSSEHYDTYYKKARIAMAMIREEFKSAFEKCDMILAPVMPGKPEQSFNSNPVGMYKTNIFTVPANIAGLPAVSLPIRCAEDKNNGIPVSFQLLGKRFDDINLLGFARVFERETGISNANIAAEVK